MDRGVWRTTVHGVAMSQTQPKWLNVCAQHFFFAFTLCVCVSVCEYECFCVELLESKCGCPVSHLSCFHVCLLDEGNSGAHLRMYSFSRVVLPGSEGHGWGGPLAGEKGDLIYILKGSW